MDALAVAKAAVEEVDIVEGDVDGGRVCASRRNRRTVGARVRDGVRWVDVRAKSRVRSFVRSFVSAARERKSVGTRVAGASIDSIFVHLLFFVFHYFSVSLSVSRVRCVSRGRRRASSSRSSSS